MPLDFATFFETLQIFQRGFHDQIASDLRLLSESGSWAAAGTLISAGFMYGVLHAIGPGHGKVVVAGYMLADDGSLKRGLVITALSSLLQACVAVFLVLVLFYGMDLARSQTEQAAAWLETASFVLIALIGASLVWRGVIGLRSPKHACCGHHHLPDAVHLKEARGLWGLAGTIVSIGIRPCSGALLVMFFACLVGQVGAGIAATFAMGVGTALTTGTVAVAAAHSKKGILWLVGASENRLRIVSGTLKILGGLFILTLGILFATTSFPGLSGGDVSAPYNHPLMSGVRK